MAQADPVDVVLGYHRRTKHHLHRYASSPGYLDWDTQPDPFRRYEGAPQFPLDEVPPSPVPSYDGVFDALQPARPLDRQSLSQFFYDSLALSAWKEFGANRWSLRVNPSSGNLHPTEAYLLSGSVEGLHASPGLFHYSPYGHALEQRRTWSRDTWYGLNLPSGAFLIGLTSIYWRESWKYGERAFRYCHHDVGHALGALSISAAVLGWQVRTIEGPSDELLARLLAVDDQDGLEAQHPEAEHPDVLLMVAPRASAMPSAMELDALAVGEVKGTPNVLSADHRDWPIIDVVSEATVRRESLAATVPPTSEAPPPRFAERLAPARQIIRQRRSAVSMDATTSIGRDEFLRMLRRVSSPPHPAAFSTLPWRPAIHLAIFVHRVRDLASGLYFLVRDPTALPMLRASMRPEFEWRPVADDLYCLLEADARDAAREVSCGQEIASDGAFALGMIAQFEPRLREHGAWFYKRLFWETGAIGQVLYLEAEAAGVRATGIGCFFDDAMHSVLGLRDAAFQSLYHFTVGGPVEDARLRTTAAYAHRAG